MPFITEELWAQTAGEGKERPRLLCHAAWPSPDFEDAEAAADINWLVDLVSGIRSVRSEMNVPPTAIAPLMVIGANKVAQERLERQASAIKRLARVGDISLADVAPKGSAQISAQRGDHLPAGSLIDVSAEKALLEKAIAKTEQETALPASFRTKSSLPTRIRMWSPQTVSVSATWRGKVPASSSHWPGSARRPEEDFKVKFGTRR